MSINISYTWNCPQELEGRPLRRETRSNKRQREWQLWEMVIMWDVYQTKISSPWMMKFKMDSIEYYNIDLSVMGKGSPLKNKYKGKQ